jgi:hypothetical protein
MDREIARTLGELELKLRELERELTSIGRRASDRPPRAPLRPQQHSSPPPPPLQPAMPEPGRIVDEALELQSERRYSMEAQETAFGEIPATKDKRETIDLAELVRFKHTMQETLEGLIGEYSRLLSLRPSSGD